jgi:polyphosphate kinase 2 (PPK2 family)
MAVLPHVDLSPALSQEEYLDLLPRYQDLVGVLAREVAVQQRPVVVVFEAWDAAGKGGCIKRLTEGLDPRGYVVYPMQAPHHQDLLHHYLYRFWQRVPEQGHIAIFDRSWYTRVLGDRVEGRCAEAEWQRAYREINQFERQLAEFGTIIFKFWLHITPEEQLRRFQARLERPDKAWKMTPEDWQNHVMWDAYLDAADEMLLKTSTVTAPWTIVEALDKEWARIKVLRTVTETLVRELRYEPEVVDRHLKKSIRKRTRSDPRITQGLETAEEPAEEAADEDSAKKRRK